MSDFEHIVGKNTEYNQSASQNGVSQNDELVVGYKETEDLLQDAILIIDKAKEVAYHAVNIALIQRNWLLGHRIDVEILQGEQRADYGEAVINKLALDLTSHYGKGFDASNLYKFLQFSRLFPEILDAARLKSLSLTWSHYRSLLRVEMKGESDNPTIGIVLSSDTDADIAKYSVLHDNDHLFQAKYMLYMPSEEELRNEIEQQKEVFRLQHLDN